MGEGDPLGRETEWPPAVSVIAEEFRGSPGSSALAATAAPDLPSPCRDGETGVTRLG
jgi:hypothetical protein